MLEPMTVTVEVWPVAADDAGLWLISGEDAWRDGPVMADGDVHFDVESLLRAHNISPESADVIHSTSWRPEGPTVVLTYIVALSLPTGYALDFWPDAKPVTADLAAVRGKPPTHAATAPPLPRHLDVLLHALRHLRHLKEHDATSSAALGELWHEHLEPFAPALAGLYSELHVA